MAKIKLLFLIGDYGTGGKERQLTEIIKALPTDKFNIHLFMKCSTSYYFDSIQSHLCSYYSLEKKNFRLNDILLLNQFFKTVNPDVIFSFSTTLSHFSLLLKFIGYNQFRLINGSIRDAPVKFNLRLRIERVLYNFYKEVISNSKAGLAVYGQKNKKGRYVLYNGFDKYRIPYMPKKKIRKSLGFNKLFNIVMVARMDYEKDHETFIKAADKVLSFNSDVHFYLIGDGEMRFKYQLLTKSLNLNSHITFLGESDEVELFLKAADLSILTSGSEHGEGIPNVVLESLACGTPVIATDNGGTSEILINNHNGYLIPNGNYKLLANKIMFLKNNPKLIKFFSINGAKLIQKKFYVEEMVHNFEKIICVTTPA